MPGKWCSKDCFDVLSDHVDDDEMSMTDGELCSDPADEEVWPRFDCQQSARAQRTGGAWKTVRFNNEIEYLGDCGQQAEIHNLSGSGWIKVSAIMNSGAKNQQGPSADKNITQQTA